MEVFLETDRVILRRFTDADADLIVDLDADPEVRRHVSLHPTTREEAVTEIPARLAALLRALDEWERRRDAP